MKRALVIIGLLLLALPLVSAKIYIIENTETSNASSGGNLSGNGTTNYLPIWTNTTELGDSSIRETAGGIWYDKMTSLYAENYCGSISSNQLCWSPVDEKVYYYESFVIGGPGALASELWTSQAIAANILWDDSYGYTRPVSPLNVSVSEADYQYLLYNNSIVCTAKNGLCNQTTGGASKWNDTGTQLIPAEGENVNVTGTIYGTTTCGHDGALCLKDYGIASYSEIETANNLVYDAASHTFQGTTLNAASLSYFYPPVSFVWAGTHTLAYNAGRDALELQNAAVDQSFTILGSNGQTAPLQEWSSYAGTVLAKVNGSGAWTFNDNGAASSDFIVEGDTDTDLIHVDASQNRIGIGRATPSSYLNTMLDIDGRMIMENEMFVQRDDSGLSDYVQFMLREVGAGCSGTDVTETGCAELKTYDAGGQIGAFNFGNHQAVPINFLVGNDLKHSIESNGDWYVYDSNRILFTNTTGGTGKYMYIEMDAANRGWIQTFGSNTPLYITAAGTMYLTGSSYQMNIGSVWDNIYSGSTKMRFQQGATFGNGLIASYAQAGDGDAQFADQVSIGEALVINEDIQAKIKVAVNDRVALQISGDAGQTANLTEWQNDSDVTLASVSPQGYFNPGECAGSYTTGDLCFNTTAGKHYGYNGTALNALY